MLKEIVLKYLAKVNGISEKEVAALLYPKAEKGDGLDETKLNDDVLATLLSKDAERVKALSKEPDTTEIFNKAHKKATKDEREKLEKTLRERYGIEDKTLQLDDLLTTIDAIKLEKSGGKGDDYDVKKDPAYLALEKSKVDELAALTASHETAKTTWEKTQADKEVLGSVKGTVLGYFDELRPVLSKDASKAANQREIFANMFDSYDYQPSDVKGEDPLIIDKATGKRLEDGHGNPLKLKDVVSTKASSYYDFAKQTDKGNAGNTGGAGGANVEVPDSREAYDKAIREATSAEERIKIADAYEAENGGAE